MRTEIKYSRKCIISGKVQPVEQLLRFVRQRDGTYHFDPHQKLPGRGAYISNEPQALTKLFAKKLLNRAFKTKIDSSVYQKLAEEVSQWIKTKKENQM